MAEQIDANDGSIVFEHEWVEEFHKLATKAGEKDIYIRLLWPFGRLDASGFQPQVRDRTIEILLQRQSPSGSASALLQLSLPEEDSTCYRKKVSGEGEIFLSMTYPHCRAGHHGSVELAAFEIATSVEFLALVTSDAQKQ